MDSHLCNRQRHQSDVHARSVDQMRSRYPEGGDGEARCERKTDEVGAEPGTKIRYAFLVQAWACITHHAACRCTFVLVHVRAPIRYTSVKIATQMMSSACQ